MDLNAILTKIRGLLDKAESTEFEGEADTYRAKAEFLMRKYQVEQEQTLAKDPQALAPTHVNMTVTDSKDFGNHYYSMLHWIAGHIGVRVRASWVYDPEVRHSVIKATLVGYESDLRLADLMFTSSRMAFSAHLEPTVDPTLGDQVNAYRLRRAGLERNRIASLLWKAASDDGTAHGKVGALYKAECELRGEKPALSGRGVNAKLYRKEYAGSFTHRIWERLRRARDAANRQGGLPQLAGREERVNEAFYTMYPEERPVPTTADVDVRDSRKKVRKVKPYRETAADRKRYEQAMRPEAVAARSVGRTAADTVAIDGSQDTNRLDEGMETWSERAHRELDA